ncbi:MAG: hypothetical protein J1G38_01335 [Clostridiales bacterium]|nr:hypothetical protein [Clostridiales bacterium]
MIIGRVLSRVINIFTGLFAMATLVLMFVWYINYAVGGLLPASALHSLESARNYCMLVAIFLGGIEFTLKRNLIFAIIFACIVAAVAGFMIYYDVSIA